VTFDLRIGEKLMNVVLNSTPAAVKSSPKSWLPEAFRETISSPTRLELAMRRRSRADLRIGKCDNYVILKSTPSAVKSSPARLELRGTQ